MRIKQLKMQSFRGISDLTLDFDPQLNVLIGNNGSGKSSILDCSAVFLAYIMGKIRTFHSFEGSMPPAFTEKDISNGCSETKNEIDISVIGMPKDIQLSLVLTRKIFTSDGYDPLEFAKNTKIAMPNPTHYDNRSNLVDGDAFHEFVYSQFRANSMASLPLAVYYSSNRAVRDINLESSENHTVNQLTANDQAIVAGKINFKDLFVWFRNTEDLENEEWRNGNRDYRDRGLQSVRNAISSIMSGFTDLQVKRSRMEMTLKKQGQELIINQLSDGEKNLLAMVGDLARRLAIANPEMEKPEQGSGVVLIDEIELHLHPKWQRMVIPALLRTFPNCQFIITTHSPQVLGEVKDGKIYRLANTESGVTAEIVRTYGRDSNRILEDEMGVPKRNQKIKDDLLNLFRLIDDGNLTQAKQLQVSLKEEIGFDEPEFARADVLIHRKEVLGR
ncbi:MAG: ATP-binding protein [Pseudanabaena sp.]|nr:MAG: ATP-binding protein [Pseudanabaena sp.]